MSPYLTEMRSVLRQRVRLPVVRRSVPIFGVLVAATLMIAGGVVGLHQTSRPVFCVGCHEMDVHYRSWAISSHRDVSCSDCHVMLGYLNMLRTKLSAARQVALHVSGKVPSVIRGHVPDLNCKKCHPETRDLVVYHSIKITHRKHWDRGISCTDCHANVVHGSGPYKNTPSMETCFTCHDGRKAPNTCSLCHVTLGERRPSTFSPDWIEAHKESVAPHGGKDCRRCHQSSFCRDCHLVANPHPSSWLQDHAQQARQNMNRCQTCHPVSVVGGKKIQPFCLDCHQRRRAHQQLDWMVKHQIAGKDPSQCRSCHQPQFCADCHRISRVHPADWLQAHPGQAKASPERCRTCHPDYFCIGCHQGRTPPSHRGNWIAEHKEAVVKKTSNCQTCHRPDFCMSCHRTRRPESHKPGWLRVHGPVAIQNDKPCQTCHRQQDCQNCHRLPMPHPGQWLAQHPAQAGKDRQVCARCHDQSFCNACHRGTLPSSHRQNWRTRHGAQALSKSANCSNCHTKDLCQACHRVEMPHPKDWLQKHGPAGQKDGACNTCHQPSFCSNCHGVAMPHPQDWVTTHGKRAEQPGGARSCARCHSAKSRSCSQCHSAMPPPSHAQNWGKAHPATGKGNPELCSLCHGPDACNKCHGGLAMPHPQTWVMDHKSKASFKPDAVCFRCHKADYCRQCHAGKL